MKIREFKQLPEFVNMTQVILKEGDKFLTGTKVIAQKELKEVGNEICYYIVTNADKDGKNVSYRPIYDKLEE